MPVLFVSHRSLDDALVDDLSDWLIANGFADLFIDHKHIAGGAKWSDELRKSAGSCRVVMCLITENWLASSDCFSEFLAARYMDKRIFPLFLPMGGYDLNAEAQDRLARVQAEDQGVDISACRTPEGRLDIALDETVAEKIRDALKAAGAFGAVGFDPGAFSIDKSLRPSPFPGLASFGDDDADAALFYGRSREIAETLEELRAMRAAADRRPLIILGASGSGKSSLLKAGVIPRLRRETPAWLPLRAFRPGADPLLNLAEAITRTLAEFGETEAHGALRRSMLAAWSGAERSKGGALSEVGRWSLAAALEEIGARLRRAANRPEATILVSIDQAEEIARGEGESGDAAADYLRAVLSASSDWRLAFTTRTDSFPELQNHRRFAVLETRGYDLRALPVYQFDNVIEAPAKRYGVDVAPELIHAMMDDAPERDALPLLAFALERLWTQFHVSGRLSLGDYVSMGRLSGLIEDAAERALSGLEPEQRDAPLPASGPPKRAAELGARCFALALAQVNDQGETIRRVAAWSQFDAEEQALLERFDRWRLLARRSGENGDGGTVEVSHEALFREWGRLKNWLEPERKRLEALRGLAVAAHAWKRSGRDAAFLTHFGSRLATAGGLESNARFADQMSEDERAYLAACRRAERRATRRRRWLQGVAMALGLGVVGGCLGYAFEFELRREWARRMELTPMSAAELAELAPLDPFRECVEGFACPEMVVLPAGAFMMGSPDGEGDDNERPQHEVTIRRFAVSRFEITHDEWRACAKHSDQAALLASSGGEDAPRIGCLSFGYQNWRRGREPANNVSWNDAQGYVRWLNSMLGGDVDAPYRLLSEAEWEYAARAGSTTRYSFGDDEAELYEYAWFAFNLDLKTYPVGEKKANAWGLHDMQGNVWEWVQDCWHGSYDHAPDDGGAWMDAGGGDCSSAVLRGGSWLTFPWLLRSAYRDRRRRDVRVNSIGFRLARTLGDE